MSLPDRQRGSVMLRRIAVPVIGLLVLIAAYGLYATLTPPATLAGPDGELARCPSRPSCVFSGADEAPHAIKPLQVDADPETAWQQLTMAVLEMPGLYRMSAKGDYMHAVFVTPTMRFRDDLELQLRDDGEIAVRSASRFGYRDFGVNRERVEELRRRLNEAASQGEGSGADSR
jgi:uncharacterized protein (DUF1499 family)